MIDVAWQWFIHRPASGAGIAAWCLFIYGILTTYIAHSPSKPKSLPQWIWIFIIEGIKAVNVDKKSVDLAVLEKAYADALAARLDALAARSDVNNSPQSTLQYEPRSACDDTPSATGSPESNGNGG